MSAASGRLLLALAFGAAVNGVAAESHLKRSLYVDGFTGTCASGSSPNARQSPIDIEVDYTKLPTVPDELVTHIHMPQVKGAKVRNTGHGIQVEWDPETAFDMDDETIFPMVAAGGDGIADVIENPSIKPDRMLKMIPMQIHWHVTSEHSWDGMLGAAEAHIVSFVGEGEAPEWGCDEVWKGGDPNLAKCVSVFGIPYKLANRAPTDALFEELLKQVNPDLDKDEGRPLPYDVDLNEMLPGDLSYYTYTGSLTTPPCTEGLRWHVMNEHLTISRKAYSAMELMIANTSDGDGGERQLYRHNNRDVQSRNDRHVLFYDSGDAVKHDASNRRGAAHRKWHMDYK